MMGSSDGFRLVTASRDRIGKVCGETDFGYVIACGGRLRRSYRVLPRDCAWVEEAAKALLLVVPRERLFGSPSASRDGAVEESAFRAYWQIDT